MNIFLKLIPATLIFIFFTAAPAASAATEVFFIHHSTGEIYRDGGLENKLEQDGKYNLVAPWWDGNTDWSDWYDELSSEDSWDIIGSPDVLMFKSCYPNSDIYKGYLQQYKVEYRKLYPIFAAHPDVTFVAWSTPPLPKQMTSKANANRAKKFGKWLKNRFVSDYQEQYSADNLISYNVHKQLTGRQGRYMKRRYVDDPYDGHPKANSGKKVGNTVRKLLDQYF